MVLLTMTPGIARAVLKAEQLSPDDYASLQRADEPALADPKPGNPISHSQLIGLSKLLKKHLPRPCSDVPEEETTEETTQDAQEPIPSTLASLLTNTTLYAPPPPPKPPKTPEYEALMARLRAEQEALSYERMLHPPPTRETFSQRFPRAPEPFSIGAAQAASEEDDLTYEEVHRQIILIINILISIVCVAVFIWVAARHWTVGLRLGLSMGGALGIAVAEVAVYSGYVRKVKEAKRLEKKKPETKEIVKTWVLGEPGQGAEATGWKEKNSDGVRSRKGKHR